MAKRRALSVEKPRPAAEAHRVLEKLEAAVQPAKKATKKGEDKVPTVTTAIHVPKRTIDLLVQVAATRKVRHGGRASVSAVIVAVIEAQRAALEREIAGD